MGSKMLKYLEAFSALSWYHEWIFQAVVHYRMNINIFRTLIQKNIFDFSWSSNILFSQVQFIFDLRKCNGLARNITRLWVFVEVLPNFTLHRSPTILSKPKMIWHFSQNPIWPHIEYIFFDQKDRKLVKIPIFSSACWSLFFHHRSYFIDKYSES